MYATMYKANKVVAWNDITGVGTLWPPGVLLGPRCTMFQQGSLLDLHNAISDQWA